MSIWDLFRVEPKQRPASASAETESVRRITNVLDQMEADRARYIAAFAYILSRVARSDQEVSPEETRLMEEIVAKQGEFGEEQAIIVVQMAKMQSTLFSGIEDYVVTREFNGIATREQKVALLHCLFAVSQPITRFPTSKMPPFGRLPGTEADAQGLHRCAASLSGSSGRAEGFSLAGQMNHCIQIRRSKQDSDGQDRQAFGF